MVSLFLHLAIAAAQAGTLSGAEHIRARAPGDSKAAGVDEGMRAPYAIRAFTRIAKLAFEQESEFADLDFDVDLDDVVQGN